MARREESIAVFSTSFLDLLSCGMGAVIILLIIFLSQLETAPSEASPFAVVTLTVKYDYFPNSSVSITCNETLLINGREVVVPSKNGTQLEVASRKATDFRSIAPWKEGGISLDLPDGMSGMLRIRQVGTQSKPSVRHEFVLLIPEFQDAIGIVLKIGRRSLGEDSIVWVDSIWKRDGENGYKCTELSYLVLTIE